MRFFEIQRGPSAVIRKVAHDSGAHLSWTQFTCSGRPSD
jgi:hypothetical protein